MINLIYINIVHDIIKYIIEHYTLESGVRKLKELIFEIISEINLEILKHKNSIQLPLELTIDAIKNKYLKKR